MTSTTATERLEAQVITRAELICEPARAVLRRRLAEDDQRRRREAEAADEEGDDGPR